jgi:hypothetical protein
MDRDIMTLSSIVRDLEGEEVLRVVENHVKVRNDNDVLFEHRAGQVRITAPATRDILRRICCP